MTTGYFLLGISIRSPSPRPPTMSWNVLIFSASARPCARNRSATVAPSTPRLTSRAKRARRARRQRGAEFDAPPPELAAARAQEHALLLGVRHLPVRGARGALLEQSLPPRGRRGRERLEALGAQQTRAQRIRRRRAGTRGTGGEIGGEIGVESRQTRETRVSEPEDVFPGRAHLCECGVLLESRRACRRDARGSLLRGGEWDFPECFVAVARFGFRFFSAAAEGTNASSAALVRRFSRRLARFKRSRSGSSSRFRRFFDSDLRSRLRFFSFSRLRFFPRLSWLDDEEEESEEEDDEAARPMASRTGAKSDPKSTRDAPASATVARRDGRLALLDPGTRGAIWL